MKFSVKKIIALTVLSSFLAISFFGFAIMLHQPEQTMVSDCPFSLLDQSFCPQNTLAVTIHHLLAYHNFINVPLGLSLTLLLIVSLLSLVWTWLIIFKTKQSPDSLVLNRFFNGSPPEKSSLEKINHWLALLETSPTYF